MHAQEQPSGLMDLLNGLKVGPVLSGKGNFKGITAFLISFSAQQNDYALQWV